MLSASATFRIPLVFAGLLVIAIMGIVMYMAASVFERRWASWATRGSEIGGYMGAADAARIALLPQMTEFCSRTES